MRNAPRKRGESVKTTHYRMALCSTKARRPKSQTSEYFHVYVSHKRYFCMSFFIHIHFHHFSELNSQHKWTYSDAQKVDKSSFLPLLWCDSVVLPVFNISFNFHVIFSSTVCLSPSHHRLRLLRIFSALSSFVHFTLNAFASLFLVRLIFEYSSPFYFFSFLYPPLPPLTRCVWCVVLPWATTSAMRLVHVSVIALAFASPSTSKFIAQTEFIYRMGNVYVFVYLCQLSDGIALAPSSSSSSSSVLSSALFFAFHRFRIFFSLSLSHSRNKIHIIFSVFFHFS